MLMSDAHQNKVTHMSTFNHKCVKFSVFLTTQMTEAPTTDLWIGLHKMNHYAFVWTDGRPMRYTHWTLVG